MAFVAPSSAPRDATRVHLEWVIRLRWGGLVSQGALALAVAALTDMALPWPLVLSVLGMSGASNLVLGSWLSRTRRIPRRGVLGALALDVGLLTFLLRFTGGPLNPFTFLYMAQVALACVVLPARHAWFLSGLAVLAYGTLFLDVGAHAHHHVHHMELHLRGMWVAFAVTAVLLGFVVGRLQRELLRQAASEAALRDLTAKNERLAALATLAGGAAHEFSTPLATIALAASEMREKLRARDGAPELLEDTGLVLSQVERCREILRQMAADAGESLGEAPTTVSLGQLVADAAAGLGVASGLRVEDETPSARLAVVCLPRRALAQALKGVLKNALHASSGVTSAVCVQLSAHASHVEIAVVDEGVGMDTDVRSRAGEPFFTTKAAGEGMGLGLFLATTLAERLGGQLEIDSSPGRGTRVAISLPRALVEET